MAEVEKGNKKRAASASDAKSSKRRKNPWKRQQKFKVGGSRATIDSGDSGIFVTCDRGREIQCVAEVLDILSPFAPQGEQENQICDNDDDDDIETQIRKETEAIQSNKYRSNAAFQAVHLDIHCLTFIKTSNILDPVRIVHSLCREAQAHPERKRIRWTRRMTPVSRVRKLLGDGLEEVAREVLEPHFHSGGPLKKFAIRPTIRNNTAWDRDTVITTVARMVGPGHSVDLKHYDLLILVDIVQNVCGMSVVGSDYEELKRYNPSEILSPTPRPLRTPVSSKTSDALEQDASGPTG